MTEIVPLQSSPEFPDIDVFSPAKIKSDPVFTLTVESVDKLPFDTAYVVELIPSPNVKEPFEIFNYEVLDEPFFTVKDDLSDTLTVPPEMKDLYPVSVFTSEVIIKLELPAKFNVEPVPC